MNQSRELTTGNDLRWGIDALLPAQIAQKAEAIGAQKARLDAPSLFVLAVLAGAFIALGAMFATTTLAGADGVIPFGASRALVQALTRSTQPNVDRAAGGSPSRD